MLYCSDMAYQLVAKPSERTSPVLTRPGFAAPWEIIADADLEDIGLVVSFVVRVSSGGTFRMRRLTVQPKDIGADAEITSRALRSIRLDELAREAVRRLERPVAMREDFTPGAFQIKDDPERIWASHGSVRDVVNPEDQIWVNRPAPGHRQTPREQAEQAARIYAEAVASGSRAPTQAVAGQLGYSRSQASRMIRTARELGLLGETATTAPIEQVRHTKQEAPPPIFRDPNGPRPWEDNEGKRTDASDQDN